MKLPRRTFLQFAGAAAAAPMFLRAASAQAYPTRPITLIVPFPAGGPTDVVARVVAERMGKALGQPMVIENVSGADGSIGLGRVARARPDGYTIDLGSISAHVLNGAVYALPYDVLNDFAPIAPVVTDWYILFARKTLAAKNFDELIAWLKADPGKATAGVGAVGPKMVTAFFQKQTGTRVAMVPYRGTAPRVQDLLAGQIDLSFGEPDQLPLARAGSIKAYAVTSDARLAIAPDIPTFAELGLPAFSFSSWIGLFAPAGTPRDIIRRLNAAAVDALADPLVRARLNDFGFEIFPREQQTPEMLGALQKADAEKWWPIIKEIGLRSE
jgi:tripartite-type tricarboxylate transporter receptor subunit TctC